MSKLKLWHKIGLAIALLWVCLHPLTRPIVVWLLIPGTGFDDLFVAGIIIFIFVQIWKNYGEKHKA